MYKNKEWLKQKYIDELLSMCEIAKMCNVCIYTICTYLKRFDIKLRSLSEAHHLAKGNHCNLSQEAIEWINGELLGDGCLQSYSSYSARFVYGSKYPEYIKYVSDTLKSFGIEQIGRILKQEDKRYGSFGYKYCSRAYEELLPIHKQWYPEGKKIVPKDIELTPLTCRQWYIGDGSLIHYKRGRPAIKLCTCGFTILNVEWLMERLSKLKFKVSRTKENIIYISSYSVKDFLKYIDKCPKVKCYQYKWSY